MKAPTQTALASIAAFFAMAAAAICDQQIDIVAAAKENAPIVAQFGIELPVTVAVCDEHGQPAPDIDVRLVWGDADRAITTDDNGRAEIALIKPMWTAGAKVIVPKPYRGKVLFPELKVRVIAKAEVGDTDKAVPVSLEGLRKIQKDGAVVYYPDGREQRARELLDWLSKMKKYIIGLLDLTPVTPYGFALFETKEKALTIRDPGGMVLLPFSVQHLGPKEQSFEISWAGVHEWAELSLVTNNRLYLIDDRLRFAGDGLAEYAAFVFCRKNAKEAVRRRFAGYIERCDQMLDEGIGEYDLTEFRAHVTVCKLESGQGADPEALVDRLKGELTIPEEEARGYPMSFWFWWDLVERKRPDIPRRFVKALDGAQTFEDVIAALEQVAGENVDLSPNVSKAKAAFEDYLRRFH